MREKYTFGKKKLSRIIVYSFIVFIIIAIISIESIIFFLKYIDNHSFLNNEVLLFSTIFAILLAFVIDEIRYLTKIHEYLHAIRAKSLDHKAEVIMDKDKLKIISEKRGLKINGFTEFKNGEEFGKKEFIYIVSFPLLLPLILIILMFLSLFLPIKFYAFSCFFSLLFLLKLTGCADDLTLIYETLIYYKNNNKIKYCGDDYIFKIFDIT